MMAFPIRNDDDLRRAHDLVDELWDAEPGSPEFDTLDIMSTLIDRYESRKFPPVPADPVIAIQWKMKELGWSQRELGRRLRWGTGRVSEVLGRKRPLTLAMVRTLSQVLELQPGFLASDHHIASPDSPTWVALPPDLAAAATHRATQRGQDLGTFVVNVVQNATGLSVGPNPPPLASPPIELTGWTTMARSNSGVMFSIHDRDVAAPRNHREPSPSSDPPHLAA